MTYCKRILTVSSAEYYFFLTVIANLIFAFTLLDIFVHLRGKFQINLTLKKCSSGTKKMSVFKLTMFSKSPFTVGTFHLIVRQKVVQKDLLFYEEEKQLVNICCASVHCKTGAILGRLRKNTYICKAKFPNLKDLQKVFITQSLSHKQELGMLFHCNCWQKKL